MKESIDTFMVEKRAKDGFINATQLLDKLNESRGQNLTIRDYLESKETRAFISRLVNNEASRWRKGIVYMVTCGRNIWFPQQIFVHLAAFWLKPPIAVRCIPQKLANLPMKKIEHDPFEYNLHVLFPFLKNYHDTRRSTANHSRRIR